MTAEYRIHRPFVLATLPRPLAHTEGRIVAGDVFGWRDGKKRKRTELAVGVDGESVSIYDVPASRLITSYPIPPQDSFTCAPHSIRTKLSDGYIARYTYTATVDGNAHTITLYKDMLLSDGKTRSTTMTQALHTSPIRHLIYQPEAANSTNAGDLLAMGERGEVVSMSGESLAVQWSTSMRDSVQEASSRAITDFETEFVCSSTAADLRESLFKNKTEAFSALPKRPTSQPIYFVAITKSVAQGTESRHLSVFAAIPSASDENAELQRITPLTIAPLPVSLSSVGVGNPSYEVDIKSGYLLVLSQGSLSVCNLMGDVAKVRSVVQLDAAEAFVRLSKPFLLSCSKHSIGIYNYQYRSIHATAALDLSELPTESQDPQKIGLLGYFRSQDLVVALVDNQLVTIQVQPPKVQGKRRKGGLLIDSIGRGAPVEFPSKRSKRPQLSQEFSNVLPGSMTEEYLAKFNAAISAADKLLANGELEEWEALLRKKFHVGLQKSKDLANGGNMNGSSSENTQQVPEWNWISTRTAYPTVDRRWVIYAISQVFSVESAATPEGRPTLRLILPDSNVTTYLIVAGHLTLSNIQSAFREDLGAEAVEHKYIAGDIVQCLADGDPSMTLLLHYLEATRLGEVEVLSAIRALMLSMDLIPDTKKFNVKLLQNEPHKEAEGSEMDLDDIEREIAVTEHYLGDESSIRSRGLTLAFTKLWRLPTVPTVKAMRTILRTEEILALVYLLRVELIRGAWTSLYIDPTSFDTEGHEPPPDGVIALIADLLGRCLDAIGAGGWLFNDAMSWADKTEAGDFLTALGLEVAAALEGLEGTVHLNHIIGEAVRFGRASQQGGVLANSTRSQVRNNKPITMQAAGHDGLLPLGLKIKQLPTFDKVVSGGEVIQRSQRERGHLISQSVEPYSLEKLAV